VLAAFIIRTMIALIMEAAVTSETSVNYQTTRRNIPEDIHLKEKLRLWEYFFGFENIH
jgi:hypothetical protein